jgi:hypothetical protein
VRALVHHDVEVVDREGADRSKAAIRITQQDRPVTAAASANWPQRWQANHACGSGPQTSGCSRRIAARRSAFVHGVSCVNDKKMRSPGHAPVLGKNLTIRQPKSSEIRQTAGSARLGLMPCPIKGRN